MKCIILPFTVTNRTIALVAETVSLLLGIAALTGFNYLCLFFPPLCIVWINHPPADIHGTVKPRRMGFVYQDSIDFWDEGAQHSLAGAVCQLLENTLVSGNSSVFRA